MSPAGVRSCGTSRVVAAAAKVVYSRTLTSVSTGRTRLEPEFDANVVRRMKASAQRDLAIGGSHLAAEAFHAGLVDEIHLFLNPILVGAATRRYRRACGWSSSWWTNAASGTASSTWTTGRVEPRRVMGAGTAPARRP
jgi:dihydrofolate reductase